MYTVPLFRRTWASRELLECYRPHHKHPNKRLLLDLALASDSTEGSMVTFSRWSESPLPTTLALADGNFQIESVPGHFGYEPSLHSEEMDWYLNFADLDAFATWRTPLFAQDEIQVAEHPVLASLNLMCSKEDISMRTVDEDGEEDRPTPVLVSGAERRIAVETSKSGLYGNAFQEATLGEIKIATRVIVPPSMSNILAIQAPLPGRGRYDALVIRQVLVTAYSGFLAAIEESRLQKGADTSTVIHTGFWGCGAYGGNRTLMLLLQMLAGRLAGVGRIVFHTGKPSGQGHFQAALDLYQQLSSVSGAAVEELITLLEAKAFPWGVSDGN